MGLPAARKALELDAKDARAHTLAGAILTALGEREEGERELFIAIDLDPHLPEANYHLGNLFLQLMDYDAARDYLTRARELDAKGITGELARRLLEKYFADVGEGGRLP